MIKHSDIVVAYVTHSISGATKFKELSEKKGKNVINLANLTDLKL